MDPFILLYVLYIAKICCQGYVGIIWDAGSSGTILYFAIGVAALSVAPLFHVIAHVFKGKPLSDLLFVVYILSR
jgi:hypothetical protein